MMKQARSFARLFSTSKLHRSSKGTISFTKDITIRNIDETQQKPLVALIGWSDGTQKQLSKYSALYGKQGFTTISVSNTFIDTAWFYQSRFAKTTKSFIDALNTQRDMNAERKIIFKLFSAPGTLMYIHLLNYWYPHILNHFGTNHYVKKEKEYLPNICGLILDSPVVAIGTADQFTGAFNSTDNPVTNFISSVLGKLMYELSSRYSESLSKGPALLRKIPLSLPQLVLYSKADKITGYKNVRDYIKHMKSRDTKVDYHMWDNSPHVMHYRYFPEQYEKLVMSFIEKCSNSK